MKRPLTFTPIDPSKPLPYPAVAKTRSGLICDSNLCINQRPHSTIYYQPKKQPQNIGLRCNHDDKYYRTHNTQWYNNEVLAYNTEKHLRGFLPIGYNSPIQRTRPSSRLLNNQIQANHEFAMNLNNMLNGEGGPPTPTCSQKTNGAGSFLTVSQTCRGIDGKLAVGHNPKNNSQCPKNACFECCYQLNAARGCTKHASIEDANIQVDRVDQDPKPHLMRPAQTERRPAQPERMFSQGVEGTSLERFRSVTIQDQANQRMSKEGNDKVNKTITLVLWPGTEPDPLECKVWCVLAPQWPKFALEHSAQLTKEVTNVLGSDFSGCLQVWNVDENLWVLLEMDTLEQYHIDTRKILVAFPGIEPMECKTVDTHLASISAKLSTDSCHLLHPAHQTPTSSLRARQPTSSCEKATPPSNLGPPPDDEEDITTPRPSPSVTQLSKTDELDTPQPQPAQSNCKRAHASSKIESEDEHGNTPSWPLSVTMNEMSNFYHLTIGPRKMVYEQAFKMLFSKTHKYKASTVLCYRRWLHFITSKTLLAYVASNGGKSVRKGQTKFLSQWDRACNQADQERATNCQQFDLSD
ncbi:uncharacterized protein MELLADRAFT_67713 [Melampsora larici-populina 98AG31]|uniref:Uncharacterized protein n=1 Tax=Melampsora larici-populina (strain 98AG31 / pathotype 3-4-7) TaxID=747676 RepID=F4S4B5_MELLP|nr:uncharacterized protein MELLADRAFT_67713 [Melampsora larici-populina 98AG31]EGG00494.1 hypothetical protein MELLADRAFT_67713 [Melampsora larici-populina 98AG31]